MRVAKASSLCSGGRMCFLGGGLLRRAGIVMISLRWSEIQALIRRYVCAALKAKSSVDWPLACLCVGIPGVFRRWRSHAAMVVSSSVPLLELRNCGS